MAETKKRPLTESQIKAKARKKERLAELKERADMVIDRNTRAEFSKYYTPGGELLDVVEVARLLGVTKRRVRSFINTGRLPAVRINKLYLVKFSDFMVFEETPRTSGAPIPGFFDTPKEKTE